LASLEIVPTFNKTDKLKEYVKFWDDYGDLKSSDTHIKDCTFSTVGLDTVEHFKVVERLMLAEPEGLGH